MGLNPSPPNTGSPSSQAYEMLDSDVQRDHMQLEDETDSPPPYSASATQAQTSAGLQHYQQEGQVTQYADQDWNPQLTHSEEMQILDKSDEIPSLGSTPVNVKEHEDVKMEEVSREATGSGSGRSSVTMGHTGTGIKRSFED
jgi:hypothetical protein